MSIIAVGAWHVERALKGTLVAEIVLLAVLGLGCPTVEARVVRDKQQTTRSPGHKTRGPHVFQRLQAAPGIRQTSTELVAR
jgi:hypothetical protein